MTLTFYLLGLALLTATVIALARGELAALPGLLIGGIFVGTALLGWFGR